jgi:nitrogen regulatory protein PII
MNKLITTLLEQNTKQQLANSSFSEFCIRCVLGSGEARYWFEDGVHGIKVSGKFYSYKTLKIIHDDMKVQCSVIRRCIRKIKGLAIRFV